MILVVYSYLVLLVPSIFGVLIVCNLLVTKLRFDDIEVVPPWSTW